MEYQCMKFFKNTYAQRHYQVALEHFERGRYEKAIEEIDKAIKQAPEDPDYLSTRGIFLHRMDDIHNAMVAYKQALMLAPDHVFSRYNLGLIYMKQDNAIQAIREWKEVVKQKPSDVDAIFNIAVALSHLGKIDEAIPVYKKVLKIDCKHIQAHQNLGVIYRDKGKFTLAKDHLRRLRELDSTYMEIVENEIVKCEEQEFLARLRESEELQYQSYASKSEDEGDDYSAALMSVIQGDFEKALAIVDKILEKNPADLSASIIKGQALEGLQRYSDAIAVFMKTLVDNPDSIEANFHLGNLFLSIGELNRAEAYFEAVLKLKPDHDLAIQNISSIRHKLSTRQE